MDIVDLEDDFQGDNSDFEDENEAPLVEVSDVPKMEVIDSLLVYVLESVEDGMLIVVNGKILEGPYDALQIGPLFYMC